MRISDWSSDVCSSDLLCLTISERALENPVNDVSNLRSEHLFFDSFTIVASSDNTVLKNTITYDEFCDQPYVELLLNGNFRSLPDIVLSGQERRPTVKIGRASCRERVCQYV